MCVSDSQHSPFPLLVMAFTSSLLFWANATAVVCLTDNDGDTSSVFAHCVADISAGKAIGAPSRLQLSAGEMSRVISAFAWPDDIQTSASPSTRSFPVRLNGGPELTVGDICATCIKCPACPWLSSAPHVPTPLAVRAATLCPVFRLGAGCQRRLSRSKSTAAERRQSPRHPTTKTRRRL
jgi:hypothetical protein